MSVLKPLNLQALDLSKKMLKLAEGSQKEVYEVIKIGGLMIHSTAVKSIAKKGSSKGKEWRYKHKRLQKVSAPGNPPNADLGDLIKSIQIINDEAGKTVTVGTDEEHGKFLEFGTMNNMEARPWLQPAVDKNTPKIRKMIIETLKKKLGEVSK
jgi:HK97 gp10 family phage protein